MTKHRQRGDYINYTPRGANNVGRIARSSLRWHSFLVTIFYKI